MTLIIGLACTAAAVLAIVLGVTLFTKWWGKRQTPADCDEPLTPEQWYRDMEGRRDD